MEQPNLKSAGKSFLVTFLGLGITVGWTAWTPLRTSSRIVVGGTTCPFQLLMVSLEFLFSFLSDGTLRVAPKIVVSDFFREPKSATDSLIGNARLSAILRERERERERTMKDG